MPDGQRFSYVAVAITIMVLLFYLGAQPFAAGLILPPWDKLAHFIVYATITTLLCIGMGGDKPWLVVVLVGIIGGVDEWRQMTIPGRSADLADWLMDVMGAVSAIMGYKYWTAHRAATACSACARRKL